jgi:hypothetical protein
MLGRLVTDHEDRIESSNNGVRLGLVRVEWEGFDRMRSFERESRSRGRSCAHIVEYDVILVWFMF